MASLISFADPPGFGRFRLLILDHDYRAPIDCTCSLSGERTNGSAETRAPMRRAVAMA